MLPGYVVGVGALYCQAFMLCLEGLLGATVLVLKMTGDDSIL